ncbi:hypothetical protein [Microbacterium xanthum]|uniref:hypothetical protein n=1 Tax=Microbacterium xanthum TaxID=3079794 RepID=UPI002AD4CB66|nr:hypothetical protein [Microbacterium sp. KSW-48]MDZ8171970.1 hypothetical protein [Microbacterium sp. KSW-48]
MEILLARLSALGSELVDAFVDSTTTRDLSDSARRIIEGPVHLDSTTDVAELRMELGKAAAAINRAPKASGEGNRTKRIRLIVAVPGFGPSESALLASVLSRPSKVLDASPSAVDGFLRELIGTPIPTVSGTRTNTILSVGTDHVLVATSRNPTGQPVPIADVIAALERLKRDGIIDVNVESLGYRSAFVGTVLLQVPGARIVGATPSRITISESSDAGPGHPATRPAPEVEPGPFQGALDRPVTARQRREQHRLRAALLRGRDEARCALCGETYPARFLWASHIKKRAAATEAEARDLPRIAMLACIFGCDALFEDGYVSVEDGAVIGTAAVADASAIGRRISQIRGRAVDEYTTSEIYFAWHREHVFRR